MLTRQEQANVKELLEVVPLTDLLSVASVVTNKAFKSRKKEDAIKAILLGESSYSSILNRKKITRSTLLNYLFSKNITCDGTLDKSSLIERVINYWTQGLDQDDDSKEESEARSEKKSSQIDDLSESVESVLAKQFTSWYYEKLNEEFLMKGGAVLEEKDFWPDCHAVILLPDVSEEESQEYISSSSEESLNLLRSLRSQYDLFFCPNLKLDGVKGRIDPHGLVMVAASGTLHSRSDECVGVFEQVFGLIADPMTDGNYKIKKTKLTLRKMNSCTPQERQLAILN